MLRRWEGLWLIHGKTWIKCYNGFVAFGCSINYPLNMWFVAAIVPGRPRIWLYKSLWLFSSNKYGGFARIYYASCPVLLLPSYQALDSGTLLSSLSFSQCPIVSIYLYINSTNIFGQCVVSQWQKKLFGLLFVHASIWYQ